MKFRQAITGTGGMPSLIWTDFEARKDYARMGLSESARRVRDVPNAGGDSVVSEALSCEMMNKVFNAQLLKTEMEVRYFPMGGAMTDYVVRIFEENVGVSVTRAMKYRGPYELEDARALLNKKLKGVINATRNCDRAWKKQILHVWAENQQVANTLMTTYYNDITDDVRADTVVMITVVKDDMGVGIFRTRKNRTCG